MASSFNVAALRAQFPALQREVHGRPALYLDGPAGTQVPRSVIEAMTAYLRRGTANLGGPFITSDETGAVTAEARQAMADLLGARSPDEIVFGQNMTSLTFAFSRALARTWQAGDEIIVTRIDHDANISPWVAAARDRGVTVRWLDFQTEDCTLALDSLPELLNERTRLLAITYASNAVGSISSLDCAIATAHSAGARVFVDAVHYAPHGLIDVQALDCDFLACSTYKFFGPHLGVLYGKYDLLEELEPYRVAPAPSRSPGKWENGTQSFEGLAGVRAAVDYLASLHDASSRRAALIGAMARISSYEESLSARFIAGASEIPGLRIYGITAPDRLAERTPTFSIEIAGRSPEQLATALGAEGIFVWHGHYYALALMERLGTLERGGLVRIGFIHYNSLEEVDRLLDALRRQSSACA